MGFWRRVFGKSNESAACPPPDDKGRTAKDRQGQHGYAGPPADHEGRSDCPCGPGRDAGGTDRGNEGPAPGHPVLCPERERRD